MDSVYAIGLGLGVRLILGLTTRDSFRVSTSIVGLWEGAALYYLRSKTKRHTSTGTLRRSSSRPSTSSSRQNTRRPLLPEPTNTDHYLAYSLRLLLDYIVTHSPARLVAVVLWTGLGLVLAELWPVLWYDLSLRRATRTLKRDISQFEAPTVRIPSVDIPLPSLRSIFPAKDNPASTPSTPGTPEVSSPSSRTPLNSRVRFHDRDNEPLTETATRARQVNSASQGTPNLNSSEPSPLLPDSLLARSVLRTRQHVPGFISNGKASDSQSQTSPGLRLLSPRVPLSSHLTSPTRSGTRTTQQRHLAVPSTTGPSSSAPLPPPLHHPSPRRAAPPPSVFWDNSQANPPDMEATAPNDYWNITPNLRSPNVASLSTKVTSKSSSGSTGIDTPNGAKSEISDDYVDVNAELSPEGPPNKNLSNSDILREVVNKPLTGEMPRLDAMPSIPSLHEMPGFRIAKRTGFDHVVQEPAFSGFRGISNSYQPKASVSQTDAAPSAASGSWGGGSRSGLVLGESSGSLFSSRYVTPAAERAARLQRIRDEREKVREREKERERISEAETERKRMESEAKEKERKDKAEAQEREKLEKLAEMERLAKERAKRLDAERAEKAERARMEREQFEKELSARLEKEMSERIERERVEQEQKESVRAREESERTRREQLEREREEKLELERLEKVKEKLEREKAEREKAEREKAEREKAEREKREKAESVRAEKENAEMLQKQKEEADRLERQKQEREEQENQKRAEDRIREEKRLEDEKRKEEADRAEAAKAELADEKLELERREKETKEKENKERLEQERLTSDEAERKRAEAESKAAELKRNEGEKLEAEKEREEQMEREREKAREAEAKGFAEEEAAKMKVQETAATKKAEEERAVVEGDVAEKAAAENAAENAASEDKQRIEHEKALPEKEPVEQTREQNWVANRQLQLEENNRQKAAIASGNLPNSQGEGASLILDGQLQQNTPPLTAYPLGPKPRPPSRHQTKTPVIREPTPRQRTPSNAGETPNNARITNDPSHRERTSAGSHYLGTSTSNNIRRGGPPGISLANSSDLHDNSPRVAGQTQTKNLRTRTTSMEDMRSFLSPAPASQPPRKAASHRSPSPTESNTGGPSRWFSGLFGGSGRKEEVEKERKEQERRVSLARLEEEIRHVSAQEEAARRKELAASSSATSLRNAESGSGHNTKYRAGLEGESMTRNSTEGNSDPNNPENNPYAVPPAGIPARQESLPSYSVIDPQPRPAPPNAWSQSRSNTGARASSGIPSDVTDPLHPRSPENERRQTDPPNAASLSAKSPPLLIPGSFNEQRREDVEDDVMASLPMAASDDTMSVRLRQSLQLYKKIARLTEQGAEETQFKEVMKELRTRLGTWEYKANITKTGKSTSQSNVDLSEPPDAVANAILERVVVGLLRNLHYRFISTKQSTDLFEYARITFKGAIGKEGLGKAKASTVAALRPYVDDLDVKFEEDGKIATIKLKE